MVKIITAAAIVFAVAALSGCEDNNKSLQQQNPTPATTTSFDASLYDIPEPVQPKPSKAQPIIEPEPEIEFNQEQFPNPAPIIRAEHAKIMRFVRYKQASKIQKQHVAKHYAEKAARQKRAIYKLQDEHYPYPKDIATLPVDRSRMITTDMLIPARLAQNLNSQIPGRVMLIVSRDILGHRNKQGSQYILLPAYSKIICDYKGIKSKGSTRMRMECSRALTPNGIHIGLTTTQVADKTGRVGVSGEIDHRIAERYGAAFTVSGLSAMSQSSIKINNDGLRNAASNLSNNLGQVTNEIMKQGMDLKEILSIRAGEGVILMPEKDIVFSKAVKIGEANGV